MANYSITINFFIPEHVVRKLDHIILDTKVVFDWRKSPLTHCTVKAIAITDANPPEIESWANSAADILKLQRPFQVQLAGLSAFPNAVFANVLSKDLISIHKKLCRHLPSSQPQYENENYTPHASLAMTSGQMSFDSNNKVEFGSFEVNELQLTIWDLKNLNQSKSYRHFPLRRLQLPLESLHRLDRNVPIR